jgi:hypothetical protein
MSNTTIALYFIRRSTHGMPGYHPGKLEARVMRHPGRCARVNQALATTRKVRK